MWGLYIVSEKSNFSWYLFQIWNINSWDMWLSTHYFSGLLQDLFHVFLYEIQLYIFSFSVVHFFQGTSVSIHFDLFEHYQLWMMDSKAQRFFFAKTNCVCSTLKSAPVIILSLVRLFQLWVPKSQNGECWLTGLMLHHNILFLFLFFFTFDFKLDFSWKLLFKTIWNQHEYEE